MEMPAQGRDVQGIQEGGGGGRPRSRQGRGGVACHEVGEAEGRVLVALLPIARVPSSMEE